MKGWFAHLNGDHTAQPMKLVILMFLLLLLGIITVDVAWRHHLSYHHHAHEVRP